MTHYGQRLAHYKQTPTNALTNLSIADPLPLPHQTVAVPHILSGSTVGHPSDSWVFCLYYFNNIFVQRASFWRSFGK